jgi:hypothetical protein
MRTAAYAFLTAIAVLLWIVLVMVGVVITGQKPVEGTLIVLAAIFILIAAMLRNYRN